MNPTNTLRPIQDLVRDSFEFTRKHINILAFTAAVPFVISSAANLLGENNYGSFASIVSVLLFIIGLILVNLLYPITIFKVIDSASKGEANVDIVKSYKDSMPMLLPYLWISIISLFIGLGAGVILIIPSIVFWVFSILVLPKYVLEGKRGMSAFMSSTSTIYGNFWPVLARVFTIAILSTASIAVIGLIMQGFFPSLIFQVVTNMIASIFVGPFVFVSLYMLYKDLSVTESVIGVGFSESKVKKTYIVFGVLGIIAFATSIVLLVWTLYDYLAVESLIRLTH